MNRTTLKLCLNELENLYKKLSFETQELCKQPPKYLKDLYNIIDHFVPSQELNNFVSEKFPNFKLISTKHSKFFLYVIYYCCKYNIDILPIIKLYSHVFFFSLFLKSLKICDEKILSFSLTQLRNNHIFRKYNGISPGLDAIAQSVYSKFYPMIKNDCENYTILQLLIYRLRTSVSQSLKRLVSIYYKVKNQKTIQKTFDKDQVSETILNTIMFYGYIPKIERCSDIYDKLKRLPYLHKDLVLNSIHEILSIISNLSYKITYQKITQAFQYGNLEFTKKVLEKLQIPVTRINVICYVYTILKVVENE